MIDDFRPAPRRRKSLQAALKDLPERQKPAKTENFRTPSEVAAEEAIPDLPLDLPSDTTSKKSGRWHHKLILRWPPTKKELWISVAVIVVIVSGVASWIVTHRVAKPVAAVTKPLVKPKPVAPKPTTVASALSGLPVDPSVNSRPVTGVMIENSLDARPQSGLSQASVVFEAIAEGGITRFLALYQDTQPDNIGPIRSARPYYEQWALGFDAGYAHVGGSPEALADLKSWNVRDLDQFYNGGSYHRISSRQAPHNVYSGVPTLVQLETAKGYGSSSFTGWARKADAAAKQPTARTVDLAISGPLYNVHYDYDAATNSYKRSEGGTPHIDANSGAQISPKVVIALVLPYSLESDGYHSSYTTLGSGQAYIFQDGMLTIGQWSKADTASQLSFSDAAGHPLELNAGQTWLSAVGAATKVTYAP